MTEIPSAQVTIADLYRALVDMHTDVTRVLTKMERVDERNHQADQLHADHEGRIRTAEHEIGRAVSAVESLTAKGADQEGRMRSLEKFRWQVVGALVVINALAVVIEWALSHRH